MQLAYLERRDAAKNMARFYRVEVERTLFGDYALVRQWGRIGSSGRRMEDWFTALPDAQREGLGWVEGKKRRGYQPTGNLTRAAPDF